MNRRVYNFLYYHLYFKWARILFTYPNSRVDFDKYHAKTWELGGIRAIHNNNEYSLFDYDEIFISPCALNEINCGGYSSGKYLLKIKFLGFIGDRE